MRSSSILFVMVVVLLFMASILHNNLKCIENSGINIVFANTIIPKYKKLISYYFKNFLSKASTLCLMVLTKILDRLQYSTMLLRVLH